MLQRFFAKLNGSMKLLRSEHPRIVFWKSLSNIGSKMWYRFDISWKIVVLIHRPKWIKATVWFQHWRWRVETNTKRSGYRFRGGWRNVSKQRIKHSNYFALESLWTFGAAWTQSYINCRYNDVILCSKLIKPKKCRPFLFSYYKLNY